METVLREGGKICLPCAQKKSQDLKGQREYKGTRTCQMSGQSLERSPGQKGWQAPESVFLLHLHITEGSRAWEPPASCHLNEPCPNPQQPDLSHQGSPSMVQCSRQLQPFCQGDTGSKYLEHSRPTSLQLQITCQGTLNTVS